MQFFRAVVEAISLGEEINGKQKLSARNALNLDERNYAITQAQTNADTSQAVASTKPMTSTEREKALKSLVSVRHAHKLCL